MKIRNVAGATVKGKTHLFDIEAGVSLCSGSVSPLKAPPEGDAAWKQDLYTEDQSLCKLCREELGRISAAIVKPHVDSPAEPNRIICGEKGSWAGGPRGAERRRRQVGFR